MENPIENWINNDKELYDLIMEIQSMNKTEIEQAEIAFDRLAKMYDLPIMHTDLERYEKFYEEQGIDNPRSLFEEHALLKFMEPDDDPRGVVLSSVYHVINNVGVDYGEVAEKEFGRDIPDKCQIAIKGTGFYGQVVFPQKQGKSWTELGCLIMAKLE